MASVFLAVITQRFDEGRYLQSVNVVTAALSLRFQNVTSNPLGISSDFDRVFTFCRIIKRVDGSEGGLYAVYVCRGCRR